ncbi:MAG: alpha amylase C-terminal domain-containing protein [Candidatus Gastranaerophilales bacterium]|nr:alpha amylase C-terminal domain-containing protein [Candidatus Gastranaerophilales bacterium]
MKVDKINLQPYQTQQKETQKKEITAPEYEQRELSNICYKPVSFGRTLKEHRSWGARVNPETKEVSFKLFTYPDAKSVSAVVQNGENTNRIQLENKGGGVFEKTGISPDIVHAGDEYQYEILKSNGECELIKDPYSFCQKELNGASIIYDHSDFEWQYDKQWKEDSARIKRGGDVKKARIYALNPDTISNKRSYEGVKSKLKRIKKDGFNAVEIMHIENTYSYNWGYDGVDKHAPSSYLGGADKLKELVDECHKNGLNVIFDVVPNHIGPDGNQLGRSGPYVKGANDFGDAVNYEGENSEYVRDWMINAMLGWAENYHIDGLRLDMTKYMESDYTLKQLAAEMNYHYPDVFLIAEDGRQHVNTDENGGYWFDKNEAHDKRVTRPLLGEEYGEGEDQNVHAEKIKNIIKDDTNLSRLGMDSEWDFNYYHSLDAMLYNGNTDNLINAVLASCNKVKYVMSHDEIGNYEGTRKIAKLMVPKLMLNDNISLTPSDIERAKKYSEKKGQSFENSLRIVTYQKAQLAAEKLAILLETGQLEEYKPQIEDSPTRRRELTSKLYKDVLSPIGISTQYTYSKIENSFEKAHEQTKAAMGFTFSVPGAKMVFQGDEKGDLTPFRFFRKFESMPNEDYLYIEKGYKEGQSALEESTMGKIKYSKEGGKKIRGFENLTRDLNKLNEENPALVNGTIDTSSLVSHTLSQVAGFCAKDEKTGNEIFTVSNLGETNYRHDKNNKYYIKFPEGKWVEILNTDDSRYGGSERHKNKDLIEADGDSNCSINLSRYSTSIFKRVG